MVVGHARPLEPQRPERVRDARELRRGDEDVEVLQDQPRHRPLHRRQLRCRSPTSASTTPTSRTCTSKDRKKNQGDNVPWGEGDTPIRDVLQLLKKETLADSAPTSNTNIAGDGGPGRRSEEVLRLREAGARMTLTTRIGMGLVGPGFVGAHHIDAVRRLGFVDVVAVAGEQRGVGAAEGRRARRAEGLRQLRGAASPIPTSTSSTTRRRTTCTCR